MLSSKGEQRGRIPVSELVDKLRSTDDVDVIVFDGIITGRLLDIAKEKGVKTIIGARIAEGVRAPKDIKIQNFKQLN
jgi:DNA primase